MYVLLDEVRSIVQTGVAFVLFGEVEGIIEVTQSWVFKPQISSQISLSFLLLLHALSYTLYYLTHRLPSIRDLKSTQELSIIRSKNSSN